MNIKSYIFAYIAPAFFLTLISCQEKENVLVTQFTLTETESASNLPVNVDFKSNSINANTTDWKWFEVNANNEFTLMGNSSESQSEFSITKAGIYKIVLTASSKNETITGSKTITIYEKSRKDRLIGIWKAGGNYFVYQSDGYVQWINRMKYKWGNITVMTDSKMELKFDTLNYVADRFTENSIRIDERTTRTYRLGNAEFGKITTNQFLDGTWRAMGKHKLVITEISGEKRFTFFLPPGETGADDILTGTLVGNQLTIKKNATSTPTFDSYLGSYTYNVLTGYEMEFDKGGQKTIWYRSTDGFDRVLGTWKESGTNNQVVFNSNAFEVKWIDGIVYGYMLENNDNTIRFSNNSTLSLAIGTNLTIGGKVYVKIL